jgi:hypothetical protein
MVASTTRSVKLLEKSHGTVQLVTFFNITHQDMISSWENIANDNKFQHLSIYAHQIAPPNIHYFTLHKRFSPGSSEMWLQSALLAVAAMVSRFEAEVLQIPHAPYLLMALTPLLWYYKAFICWYAFHAAPVVGPSLISYHQVDTQPRHLALAASLYHLLLLICCAFRPADAPLL